MQMSMFSLEEHPANHSLSQVCEKDLMTLVATSCLPFLPLLNDIGPVGWSGRTSPAFCPPIEDGTSQLFWTCWKNLGMFAILKYLMHNSLGWLNAEGGYLYADNTETIY